VNFLDAAHNEMIRERQLVEQAKRLSEDIMVERIKVNIMNDNFTGKKGYRDHIEDLVIEYTG